MAVKTYEGNDNYIFVSYSHKDKKKVMTVIKKLQKDGYRVWYDDGIEAGAEWPETVATHLMNCGLFLAFISKSYLESFNCKREIDFAVSKRKSFIAVMLENTELSPGMEMQLASVQFLNRYQLKEDEFYARLYQSEFITTCRADREQGAAVYQSDKTAKDRKIWRNKGYNIKKMAAIVAIILAAAGLLLLLGRNLTYITIAGTKYRFDEEYLTVKDTVIVPADTRKLARFTNLGLLKFENCDFTEDSEKNLERIGDGVRSFHLIDCKGLESYNWLGGINSIEWLEINNSGFDDDKVSGTWFLNMDKLISIDLSNNEGFSNLGGLLNSVHSGLHQIHLANTGVYSLAPLAKFEDLSVIDISGCKVESLESLQSLKNVTQLTVDDNELKSLTGIEQMTGIDTLSAGGNAIESIDAIRDFGYLEKVDLSDNKLKDISALEKSRISIKELYLENNHISDMTSLNGLRSLEVLCIDNNELDDLSFLDESDELKMLSACNNNIRSIESVLNKPGLRELYLSDNEITGDVVFSEDFGAWNESGTDDFGTGNIHLQHNNISSLEFCGRVPMELAVYDNPLISLTGPSTDSAEDGAEEPVKGTAVFKLSNGHTIVIDDYEEVRERKGTLSGIGSAYLSWDSGSGEMLDNISSFDQYTDLYLSGCPLDYMSQVEEIISRVEYMTDDKMDEITEKARINNIYQFRYW